MITMVLILKPGIFMCYLPVFICFYVFLSGGAGVKGGVGRGRGQGGLGSGRGGGFVFYLFL